MLQLSLRDVFTDEGFDVLEAVDGVQLLALLQGNRDDPPDVVVTDVDMPGLGGLDVLALVRAEGSRQAFVIVTGSSDPDAHARARALGALAVLTKPVNVTQLLRHVNAAVTA